MSIIIATVADFLALPPPPSGTPTARPSVFVMRWEHEPVDWASIVIPPSSFFSELKALYGPSPDLLFGRWL